MLTASLSPAFSSQGKPTAPGPQVAPGPHETWPSPRPVLKSPEPPVMLARLQERCGPHSPFALGFSHWFRAAHSGAALTPH